MGKPLFQKGDAAIVFCPRDPERPQTRTIAQVSRAKYGTPKVRLDGDATFNYSAEPDDPSWDAARLLLRPEDLFAAQENARREAAQRAAVDRLRTLVARAEQEARWHGHSWLKVRDVAKQLHAALGTWLAETEAR